MTSETSPFKTKKESGLSQHLDVLLVSGEDSEKFLQGQLTCDINKVTDSKGSYGAICNNKGRVVSSFLIVRENNQFLLSMPTGMGELTLKHLHKFQVFYKTELTLNPSEYNTFPLTGLKTFNELKSTLPSLPESNFDISRNNEYSLIRLPNTQQTDLDLQCWTKSQSKILPAEPAPTWQAQNYLTGFYLVSVADSEKFTPQELNYDLVGAISFDKGCYTGQEIVARIHYRGKPKQRLFMLSCTLPKNVKLDCETTPKIQLHIKDRGVVSDKFLNILTYKDILCVSTFLNPDLITESSEVFLKIADDSGFISLDSRLLLTTPL